jgi:hypothetical protein
MPQRQALHSGGVIISSLNPSMASLGLGVQFEAAESRTAGYTSMLCAQIAIISSLSLVM